MEKYQNLVLLLNSNISIGGATKISFQFPFLLSSLILMYFQISKSLSTNQMALELEGLAISELDIKFNIDLKRRGGNGLLLQHTLI